MADNPEVIRQEMEETRSNLAEKLEALEEHVSETVKETTEAVTETVEAVKETVENVTSSVQETVETVGEAFNLRVQTERHPWVVFGASVALGCFAAHWVDRMTGARRRTTSRRTTSSTPQFYSSSVSRQPEFASQPEERTQPAESGKKSWFWEELNRVKGLALGSVMGVIRDLAARNLPGALGQRVAEEVDHLTTSIGGETISGPLISGEK